MCSKQYIYRNKEWAYEMISGGVCSVKKKEGKPTKSNDIANEKKTKNKSTNEYAFPVRMTNVTYMMMRMLADGDNNTTTMMLGEAYNCA